MNNTRIHMNTQYYYATKIQTCWTRYSIRNLLQQMTTHIHIHKKGIKFNIVDKLAKPVVQTQLLPLDNPTLAVKKRKNVDNNGIELLIALLFAVETVDSVDSLYTLLQESSAVSLSDKLVYETSLLSKYKDDLTSKPRPLLKKTITHFRLEFAKLNIPHDTIQTVYLTGKSTKSFPEILELNNGVEHKKCKGDVYIKLTDGSFIGFSIKESKSATKSNYSVHKLIGEDESRLNQIKKDFLTLNGFPTHDKANRTKVNKLFYEDNVYWTELRLAIEKHKLHIIRNLVENLVCANIPYRMYEFDGSNMLCLNDMMFEMESVLFEEWQEYYYKCNGAKRRECAKLFYRLRIPGKTYRVEIRWKGDVHNASPQFQMHEE